MPTELQSHRNRVQVGTTVLDAETIQRRVVELGTEISEYYQTGELLLVGLLKGSFIFLGDLVRRIKRQHKVDFIIASSYGSSTASSGTVRLLYETDADLTDQHVLLVEDIVETGCTLKKLVAAIQERDPRSVEIVTLLRKRVASDVEVTPRFVGFDVPEGFLVGYGLDYDERSRHLPFVANLKGQDG